MKKSEIYRVAQLAVIGYGNIAAGTKLDILRELMTKEDTALFTEKQEEEKEKTSEAVY